MGCSTPSSSVPHCLPEFLRFTSSESIMLSDRFILCCLLLLPSTLQSIRVFSTESALCIKWPNYCSFCCSIRPSNEYSGLMDWFNLLAVQGTLQSLLQHNLKRSVLWRSAFFIVQLTSVHDYWKTKAVSSWTFVGKVMSLLFTMLSRLVRAFLPRSNIF